jgi:hypothetical protein
LIEVNQKLSETKKILLNGQAVQEESAFSGGLFCYFFVVEGLESKNTQAALGS